MTPTLYLIPSPLGEAFQPSAFPNQLKSIIEKLDYFIVENDKEARRFIKKIAPDKNQSTLKLFPLNKHTSEDEIATYLNPCIDGNDMGLISDAGCPGIADPGAVIVQKAYPMNIKVKPLVGPSSILLAMMSSGLNGQSFAFNGYLPIDKIERKKAIKNLEIRSQKWDQSQIFMETPYRNEKLLEDLKQTLERETKLCIAYELTQPDEFIKTMTVGEWNKTKLHFHKKPAIFIIHKPG
ncbi:SAM-dependent methyltransferase [Flavobacteriaceae bacterium]|nr:SAM-dependent methyltransferase [Flavobacteriaceae bacterium]